MVHKLSVPIMFQLYFHSNEERISVGVDTYFLLCFVGVDYFEAV